MSNIEVRSHLSNSSSTPGWRSRLLTTLLLVGGAAVSLPACSSSESRANAPVTRASSAQVLVERSAETFAELHKNPRFSAMDSYLREARGVMIFPRLVKASLIVGGEGGSGVLVARKADGSWSGPAFYGLGSPSIGLQIGYQEAAVVLFIMNDTTLQRTLSTNVALGAKAGATLGDIDDDHGRTTGKVISADIYQVIDAEGVFAGLSLDGYVMGSRARQNSEYYGKTVTPREILTGKVEKQESMVLERALASRSDLENLEASAR
jgi:lipid-binding SYLF domain-containing protein